MRDFLQRAFSGRRGFGARRRGRYVFVGSGDIVRTPTLAQRAAAFGYTLQAYAKARPWRSGGIAMAGALLVVLTVAPLAGSSFASRQISSALAMLGMRSPGERAAGHLIDTKPAHRVAIQRPAARKMVRPPAERALGKVFPGQDFTPYSGDMPFSPPYMPDVQQVPGLATPRAFNFGPTGFPGGTPQVDGGSPNGIVPGGSSGPPPGGGGGGPGGGGTPVAAVPEPATWLMMIIAFGLCGSMLRRQRQLQSRQPACASS